ncbi:hypothetical protein CSKR_106542, partial [Clonorchis sinensis]
GELAQWLERAFTGWKVRGSNPTSASQRPLSRLGQPGRIRAPVLSSGGMAIRHRKGCHHECEFRTSNFPQGMPPRSSSCSDTYLLEQGARWLKWLEREFTDRKVRGSNPTSASRLPLSRLGQPGSIPALVVPSGGTAARHRMGVTAEQFFLFRPQKELGEANKK